MSNVPHDERIGGVSQASARDAYVLVADSDPDRTSVCVAEATRVFGTNVVVAPDGERAVALIGRFGAPVLLIIELALPGKDGFAVIDALHRVDPGATPIIGWYPSTESREFASSRLSGPRIKLIRVPVAPAIVRSSIEWASRHESTDSSAVSADAPASDAPRGKMNEMAERARRICHAAGAAVYLKLQEDTEYRATVTWTGDSPMPASPALLPAVLELVVSTGNPVIGPESLADHPAGRLLGAGDLCGIVAVPIVRNEQTAGVLVLFDTKPIEVDAVDLDALNEIARLDDRPSASIAHFTDRDSRLARLPPAPAAARRQDHPTDEARVLPDRSTASFAIGRELARVRRERLPLSVVMFGLNASGPTDVTEPSEAAREALARAMRGSDLAIRWDSGHVLIVLAGLSGADARRVAERLRAAMHAGARFRAEVSAGVAELTPDDTFDVVVARAGERLQQARAQGHNRTA